MNSLLDENEHEDARAPTRDREISLGTTMILGIFFALAVYGAALFGVGYSMGSKHSAGSAVAANGPTGSTTFNTFKPAPGNPIGAPAGGKQPPPEVVNVPYTPPPVAPARAIVPITPTQQAAQEADAEVAAARPSTARLAAPVATPVAPTAAPTPTSGPLPVVQVAAVSHEEDADLIATTLKRKGYAVSIRQEAQDKLLHVQIGPFQTKKDAEAMRQRLLADGFNAYIK